MKQVWKRLMKLKERKRDKKSAVIQSSRWSSGEVQNECGTRSTYGRVCVCLEERGLESALVCVID